MAGDITCFYDKVKTEWILRDFRNNYRNTNFVSSTPFAFLNTKCYMKVNMDYSKMLDISIHSGNLNSDFLVNFTLSIKNISPTIKYGPKTVTFGPERQIYNVNKSDEDEENVTAMIEKFKHENMLTFDLQMHLAGSTIDSRILSSSTDDTAELCNDLHSLLLSEKGTDVTFHVQGEIFKVHKVFLNTRAPALFSMLQQEMLASSDGIARINDVNPEVISKVLLYLYTASLGNMSQKLAIPLYAFADKCNLSNLKKKCATSMKEMLTVDTVCDILALGLNDEYDLKKSAERFAIDNMEDIIVSREWQTFASKEPLVALKMLRKAYLKDSS